jgi:hypothetical protein
MTEPTEMTGGDAAGILAARIRVNAATEIRVLSQPYKGKDYLHIRQFALGDTDFVPTSKGVSLPIERLADTLSAVQELRAASSDPAVIAVVPKNSREEVRFSIATWAGATKADIRIYYQGSEGEDRKPGKGVRFNLALLADMERGLEALDRTVNG